MRPNRALSVLAALAVVVFAATSAFACGNDSANKVSGTFDKAGRFVLTGAWNKDGTPIANTTGLVLASYTVNKNIMMPASTLTGKQVCLFGDLDVTKKTMNVDSYVECGAGACPSAGAGCSAAKGASAAAAGAGHCPAMAGNAAANASSGQCTAGAAKMASAGDGCCAAKGAAAKGASAAAAVSTGKTPVAAAPAGAGAGCCASKGAAAAASAGSTCHGDATSTKAAKSNAKSASAANQIVYKVSGLHCGDCASKVQGAVAALALPNVTDCSVSVEKGQAIVTTKGDVDREAIQKAITAAGYPAELAPAEVTQS